METCRSVLLLTGATGLVGSALLRRLTAAREPVRCLVRDPRRLGPERVRVQIALGDLADPPSFRNALRGVKTVVHLAAAIRDQPHGSIEELNGIATWRMVEAAERAGVERFVFFSRAVGAAPHNRTRFLRAKALAEEAVRASSIAHTVFAPSIIYAPGDPYLTLLERLALLPVMPVSGAGRARTSRSGPHDVAECVMAALDAAPTPTSATSSPAPRRCRTSEIVELALRAAAPPPARSCTCRRRSSPATLRVVEALMKSKAPATWDEAELMEVSLLAERGTADAERLGVTAAPHGRGARCAVGRCWRSARSRSARAARRLRPLRPGP